MAAVLTVVELAAVLVAGVGMYVGMVGWVCRLIRNELEQS